MKAFLAIVGQTIRSATRSKVFHVLFALILLAVFLLPTTISGDGTAAGLVQISVTYSLNVVVALISATTLWLSCALLSREIENYTVHMVVSKPCPRWKLWLGKWIGILLMHTFILIVSAVVIYVLILWRVNHGNFNEQELSRLHNEILVGRRTFRPQYPNFTEEAEKEYERNLSEYAEGHDPKSTKAKLRQDLMAQYGEVKPGATKEYVFRNVRLSDPRNEIFLRYRAFSGSTSDTNQRMIPCLWAIRIPAMAEKVAAPFLPCQQVIPGGTYQEKAMSEFLYEGGMIIPAGTDLGNGNVTTEDMLPASNIVIDEKDGNTVVIRFTNPPAEAWQGEASPVVFQVADGPFLLTKVTGFGANYMRTMILAFFQLAFLAALGCTVGSAFSTPVAAFAAIAYLVIGMTVQMAVSAPLEIEQGKYLYKSTLEKINHKFAQAVSVLVVSVDDLDSTSDLARGNLVEYPRIGQTFLTMILLRSGLLAAIGIWILTKREFGLVARK